MARTEKQGLSYFSHDVDINNDIKIKYLLARHGRDGKYVYLDLLEKIYGEKGYYIELTEKFIVMFADECKLEINVCKNIINDCINEELFDINLFNAYNILTSRRIQDNFLQGKRRSKSVNFIKEFMLVNCKNENVVINSINANINSINANINLKNVNINSQSKVNKSKVNKNSVATATVNINSENVDNKKNVPQTDFIDSLIGLFQEQYLCFKKTNYLVSGKDRKAIGGLLRFVKNHYPQENSQQIMKRFEDLFKLFLNLNDNWYRSNCSLSILNSKINEIILIIKNEQTNKNGAGEARGFTRGFDIRKNSWLSRTVQAAIHIGRKNGD